MKIFIIRTTSFSISIDCSWKPHTEVPLVDDALDDAKEDDVDDDKDYSKLRS